MTADTTLAPCPTEQWKCGNELLPYHPSASHVDPAYRDGWNACYAAFRGQAPAPQGPALVQQMLEVMESATSFTSKKARDEHPNVVAAARKWLAAHGITGAPNAQT